MKTSKATGFTLAHLAMAAGALVCLMVLPVHFAHAQSYTVIDLGPTIVPFGLNKSGQVVGYGQGPDVLNPSYTNTRALRWDAANGVVFLPESYSQGNFYKDWYQFPEGLNFGFDGGSFAAGINNAGDIVGIGRINLTFTYNSRTFTFGALPHAFQWSPNGASFTTTDLGVLPPGSYAYPPGANGYSLAFDPFISEAKAINDAGQITGVSQAPAVDTFDVAHAFLFSDGVMQDIDPDTGGLYPDGITGSYGLALNNPRYDRNGTLLRQAQVIGQRSSWRGDHYGTFGFLWSQGTFIDLSPLGGIWSEANGINDASQVVGDLDTGTIDPLSGLEIFMPFVWQDANGDNIADPSEMQVLAVPSGFIGGWPTGINNAGQVVGSLYYEAGLYGFEQTDHAALWDMATGTVYDLHNRIDPSLGLMQEDAWGINDNGEIIVAGIVASDPTNAHGFLLKPISNTTSTGSSVSVTPTAGTSLTFDTVSSPGTTSVTTLTNPPSLPPNYQGVSVTVDIATTATFSGPVSVCVSYDPTQFTDPSQVHLLHYTNGVWQDITTSVNTQNHIVCGTVTSFSPFELATIKPVSWSGVLQPINADGSSVFKLGSTVPVKFQLTGVDAGKTNLIARLYLSQQDTVDPSAVNEAVSTATADAGNTFRYDATAGQYLFNLSTKGLSQGTWYLRIDLGDGANHIVQIKLK